MSALPGVWGYCHCSENLEVFISTYGAHWRHQEGPEYAPDPRSMYAGKAELFTTGPDGLYVSDCMYSVPAIHTPHKLI